MYNPTYLKAILIYVRDKQTGYIHIVGTDQHDRLYLDDNGNIQYMNLQNGGTTEEDYEFVLDEQGHNQNNLTFTKEEQELIMKKLRKKQDASLRKLKKAVQIKKEVDEFVKKLKEQEQ